MNPIIKNYIIKFYTFLLFLDILYITATVVWSSIIYANKIVNVEKLDNHIYHGGYCSDNSEITLIQHNYYCNFPSENRLYCNLVDKDFKCYGIYLNDNSVIHLKECLPKLDLNEFKEMPSLFQNCMFQIYLPLSIASCFLLHIMPIFIICLDNCKYINEDYQQIV